MGGEARAVKVPLRPTRAAGSAAMRTSGASFQNRGQLRPAQASPHTPSSDSRLVSTRWNDRGSGDVEARSAWAVLTLHAHVLSGADCDRHRDRLVSGVRRR